MATEKWIAGSGVGLTWTAAFSTEFTTTALPNGDAIASSVVVTNGTALDMFADIGFYLASLAVVSPNFFGVYLYPLNQDGSTYGDSRFGSAAAGPPPPQYFVGNIGLVAATQVQTGMLTRIILPPGSFKFVLYNQAGVTTASSGNVCDYRTYNRSVA